MKVKTAILLLFVLVGFSVPVNAALIDRGIGMIYDTELGITWLKDANHAATLGNDNNGAMVWDDAMTWAGQLSFAGFNDWRLPDAHNQDGSGPVADRNVSSSELGHMFYNVLGGTYGQSILDSSNSNIGLFENIQAYGYWSETEVEINPNAAWFFYLQNGWQGGDTKDRYEYYAWAVRDGDYGPSVTETQAYQTEMFLGSEISFDYWWELGMEPIEDNFDVLFFNGTEWETFGWNINFDGNSNDWQTASFWVPPWLRGEDVQIMFSLFDKGQPTDPTVYLRNIGSASAPVPEPATIILLGTGLLGLAGASTKNWLK